MEDQRVINCDLLLIPEKLSTLRFTINLESEIAERVYGTSLNVSKPLKYSGPVLSPCLFARR
jgi:hypothetical protein